MPASISIKRVPDEILVRLRNRAKSNRRSLQGELLAILEEAARPRRLTLRELQARVREIGLRTGNESATMIRRDRDAR